VSEVVRIAFPTGDIGGLDDKVYPRFARAPTLTIVEVDEAFNIINVKVLRNPAIDAARGAAVRVAELLSDESVSVVATASLGPHASAVLQNLGVRVVYVEANAAVRGALKKVRETLK